LIAGVGSPHKTILYWFIAIVAAMLVGLSLGTPTAQAADTGHRDFSFTANAVTNPTGEKPQSKLWFNDGIWWASLFNRSTEEHHIYRYDWSAHTWSDTGTLIDERNSSKADILWDGTHLYVVSAGSGLTTSSHGARILRYSYDPTTKRYTRDQGFPVTITNAGLETIVLDKDTTGKLWVTYTQNSKVYVNRTLSDDRTWGTPFVPPVNGTSVNADDISAVVAFDSQIGVMWSNQNDSAMYFATHRDGDPDDVWQGSRTAIQGPNYADDHISLRSLQAADSSGRVFAAVKTSLNDLSNPNPNAPLNLLLVRDRDGNWTNHVFGRVGDNHTRPIVMLDEEHRDLYMFATAPCCTGGAIYYKKTSLNNISFSEGLGEPFIKSDTDVNINDATSTKQNVSSATGLVVMASSGTVAGTGGTGSGYYWHNAVNLAAVDGIPPDTTISSGPSGTVSTSSASFAFSSTEPDSTFECSLDGGAFGACTSPKGYNGLSDGSHTFQVRATDASRNTDATPASRSWTVDTTAPTIAGVAPADGAKEAALTANAEASFSEAMDASTVNGSTFTLTKQGAIRPLTAQVSYDTAAKKTTLDLDVDLEAGATYTATIKGGTGGVKDLAGNALAENKTWSFTTKAAVLSAPTNLSAARSGSSKNQRIDLSWIDNSNSEANFVIERSTTSSFTSNLVTYQAPANATSYPDTALQGRTTYYYRVFAVNATGTRSAPSNVASVTTK
jgi:Big-like domain-containing protein